MAENDYISEYMGQAAAATTPQGGTPNFGLAYDLATANWYNADQFRAFVRDVLPVTQQELLARAQRMESERLANRELQIAQNYERFGDAHPLIGGIGFTPEDVELAQKGGIGNQLLLGFKGVKHIGLDALSSIFGGRSLDPNEVPDDAYEQYSKSGGLLTEAQFNAFEPSTRAYLLARANAKGVGEDVMKDPFVAMTVKNFDRLYRGAITAIEQGQKPFWEIGSSKSWGESWKEAQGESLGNSIIDGSLQGPLFNKSDEELENLRRNNAWYQMSSVGAEFLVGWYADPGVLVGKGIGAAARFTKGEMPLVADSASYLAVRQVLNREKITATKNPITKAHATLLGNRMLKAKAEIEEYAKVVTASEFATLNMFKNKARAVDGGASAYALHWAINHGDELTEQLNSPEFLAKLAEEGKPAPTYIDVKELTWDLFLGGNNSAKSFAMLNKLEKATPDELARIAPGAQTLIDSVNALKTRASVLESEVDDLAKEAARVGDPVAFDKAFGPGEINQPKFAEWQHRWEVHTDLAKRQAQLDEATMALGKYTEYDAWLETLTARTTPELNRIQKPSKSRWSQVRKSQGVEGESRSLFMDNPYGFAHSFHRIPKSLFLKRANAAEIHNLDSGLTSINRTFDQLAGVYGYRPEGVREGYLQSYFNAATNYDRYKILHELEETHLIAAISERFEVAPETARAVVHKIYSERDRSIRGILSGQGAVYSSAPTFKERLMGGAKGSPELVGLDPDTGMLTVNLMDGRHKTTYQVHESALVERVNPEDVTQTPNYYNPLDHRRLFHQLKHDKQMLDEIDADIRERGQAAMFSVGERLATHFYEFWKPLQLFRLGWPQRVLMDEGARAMAINGPMYWLTGAGAEALYHSGRNVVPAVADAFSRRRHGPLGVPIGPGPVAQRAVREPDAFKRAHTVDQAPLVPESHWPKWNKRRGGVITAHAAAVREYQRLADKHTRWVEEANRQAFAEGRQGDDFTAFLDARGGLEAEHLAKLFADAEKHGVKLGISGGRFVSENFPDDPTRNHPVHEAYAKYEVERLFMNAGERLQSAPMVFDPVNGRQLKSGHIVPIDTDEFRHYAVADGRGLEAWYERNAEMLSRQGIRMVFLPDGNVTVGRLFRSNEFKKAAEFAQYVGDAPVWNLGRSIKYVVGDANKMSAFTEAALSRQIVSGEQSEAIPGKAPIEGEPAVFHGTDRDLPDPLGSRTSAPVDSGRMLGDGLYTTMDQEIAETYGGKVYTIRGSRTGKVYDTFDLDQPAEDLADDIVEWLHEQRDPVGAEAFAAAAHGSPRMYYNTMQREDGKMSWANVYEEFAHDHNFQRLMHEYLETRHNAGALTHKGGTTYDNPHQVYVWLHPEDLEVKPLYVKNGKFENLVEWLAGHSSREIPIPENRIIRKGIRNPMIRELRTLERQIAERKAALGAEGRGSVADPEYRQMVVREAELMDALGLEYRHNTAEAAAVRTAEGVVQRDMDMARRDHEAGRISDSDFAALVENDQGFLNLQRRDADEAYPNAAILPETYVVVDEGRFERIVDEAMNEDQARTLAREANGELRAQERGVEDLDFEDLDFDMDDPLGMILEKIHERHTYGGGNRVVTSSDGKSFEIPNAFEGHQGQLMRALTASNGALDVLSEGHGQGTSLFRKRSEGYRVYSPPQFTEQALRNTRSRDHKKVVRYFQVYADMVNDHLGNSPIVQMMLKGKTNDEIIEFLDETPAGARIRREVIPESQPSGVYVDQARSKLNYYVPSRELQRRLVKERLKPSDFRKRVADEDLPAVYGPDLEILDRRRSAGEFLSDTADKMWKGLGNVPIDHLSRHPFAKSVYDAKINSLVRSVDAEWLTPELLERLQQQARTHTMNEVRRTLYNLTDTTNFNDALRFAAPFWNAQYEAITKWLRIISDRPETVARFLMAQNAVYQNFAIVDREGQPVESQYRKGGLHNLGLYQPEDRVVINLPKWLRERVPGLEHIAKARIPIGSANTILQGELPLFPGMGPLVTIPADEFLRQVSDTYGVEHDEDLLYRMLFPVGRPRSKSMFGRFMEQMDPSWLARLRESQGPEDSVSRINLEVQLGREMLFKANQEGKRPPTMAEIKNAADGLWFTRIISGLVQPAQVQFLPEHQYWVDQAHRYQREYGQEWWDRYVDDFGAEFAIFAQSSTSSLGVPPTKEGMKEYTPNKELIAEYPKWTSAIISPQAYMGDFSSDAYGQQFNIIPPGTTTPLRTPDSLQARLIDEPEVRLGWREYRKYNAAIEAALYSRGLTSIQQRGAEDLQQLKRAAVSKLTKQYPSWRRELDKRDESIYSDVNELRQIVALPQFDNRPDFQGVRQYLVIRDQVTRVLDRLGQMGRSRSLQAQENLPLAQFFYNQVGQLVQANPAFAEFYTRYLDSDDLSQGGGGF